MQNAWRNNFVGSSHVPSEANGSAFVAKPTNKNNKNVLAAAARIYDWRARTEPNYLHFQSWVSESACTGALKKQMVHLCFYERPWRLRNPLEERTLLCPDSKRERLSWVIQGCAPPAMVAAMVAGLRSTLSKSSRCTTKYCDGSESIARWGPK